MTGRRYTVLHVASSTSACKSGHHTYRIHGTDTWDSVCRMVHMGHYKTFHLSQVGKWDRWDSEVVNGQSWTSLEGFRASSLPKSSLACTWWCTDRSWVNAHLCSWAESNGGLAFLSLNRWYNDWWSDLMISDHTGMNGTSLPQRVLPTTHYPIENTRQESAFWRHPIGRSDLSSSTWDGLLP